MHPLRCCKARANVARSCGSPARTRRRQSNHLPANAPCGSPALGTCDQADACDGSGSCLPRTAPNGSPCDDGAFCTTGDQCRGGQCVATGQQNCGANSACNEAADQCQCQGCQVGNSCFAAGTPNPQNPCQVCNPTTSPFGFSANAGATCGSGPAECSEQDTCNAQGQCAPNNLPNGAPCTSVPRGACQNALCVSVPLPIGATCTQDFECSTEHCQTFFRDRDGDGYGSDVTTDQRRVCNSLTDQSLSPIAGYVALSGDCCDRDGAAGVQSSTIFPGQRQFFDTPQSICSNIADRDYDCSGAVEFLFQDDTQRGAGTCAYSGCNGDTIWDVSQTGGSPPRCGAAGPILTCSGTSGACTAASQGFTTNFCR